MEFKRIRMAEGEISYLELGTGPDLLFLHGAVTTAEAYIPLLLLLSKTYHVLAPTHPGHGDAFPIPRDWKLVDFIRFYQDLFIELNFSPEICIGHSFGGTLTLLLAAEGTGNHVVAMDAPGLPFTFDVNEYAGALMKEAREALNKRRNVQGFLEASKVASTLVHTVVRHPNSISLFTKQGPKFNIYHELQKITIPVDLLWGERDRVVPLEIAEKMKKFIPHVYLTVFPNFGHNYPVTDPEFTYREIMKVIGDKR
jgi:pimeloyl-ACP methyl ester carboxylesterase